MTLHEALTFIGSEITTRTDYGRKLVAKKPPPAEWVVETERDRLRKFHALKALISSLMIGEMNGDEKSHG